MSYEEDSANGGGAAGGGDGVFDSGGLSDSSRESGRDRDRTEREILRAVGRVLAARGFGGLGVNSVAREAGVDKVLIYRYFGGLDELMAVYAKQLDFWPSVDEIVGFDGEALLALPLDQRLAMIIKNLVRAVHRRPLTPMILGWRLVESNELTRHLDDVRIRVTDELYGRYVSPEEARSYPHVLSTARLIGNGALYIVIGSRNRAVVSEPEMTGDLEREEGWAVMDGIIERLFAGVFPPAGAGESGES